MICCHRHYGICPIICCKYDAGLICWGCICCKTIVDPCWIFRMIMHVLCICAPESICPTKNKCFKWFCCNAKPEADTGALVRASSSSTSEQV